MRTRAQRIARLFLVLPVFLFFAAVMIWAVMSLWNWLMPSIFSVHAITYWQALGLVVLSWILFRGFRGPRFSRGHWEHRIRERWRNMTPEQREEFVKGIRGRWHDLRERWESMAPEDRAEFVKGGRGQWQELRELWEKMTPEEREELIRDARNRAAKESSASEPKA
jgi:hypothetical protein